MQTQNPILDDIAKLMTSAVGAAQGLGEEARTFLRAQAERIVADMDLVRRDEHEALADLLAQARQQIEAQGERIAALESALAARGPKA